MTYMVDGVQYVAVMAGWGGGGWFAPHPTSAAVTYGNYGRILAFKLGGTDMNDYLREVLHDPQAAASTLSPIRRDILGALAQPGSATTVGQALGIARQKVNYHLRALEEAGLVEHVEDRRKGNCTERIVRATATHYLIAPSVLGPLEPSPAATADRFSSDHLAAVAE